MSLSEEGKEGFQNTSADEGSLFPSPEALKRNMF